MASDIALIHKLTSLNDVNRLLHETVAKERSIDSDLDRLLSKRVELERSFLLLNAPTVEMLELVHADCEQLLSSASSTAQLATHISSKVRCLDTAQTAVSAVLSKISLILDCSTAIAGVKEAMEKEDYEAAAQHIATFTELDARLTSSTGRASGSGGTLDLTGDLGQAENHRAVLLEAKQKLEGVVNRQFDDAVARRDMQGALRFAALYKPLGKQAEGLKRFSEYLQLTVASQVRAHVTSVSEQVDAGKKVDWTAALAIVFKDVAQALESNEAFVRNTFGNTAVLDLATALQNECDSAGGRLIARFMEARKVAALVKEASSRRNRGSAAGAGAAPEQPSLDHRMLEGAISELLALSRMTEEYNQFILSRMRQAAGGTLTANRETSFRSGALNVGVRELLAHYMSLEEMYMYETAGMAIRIDEFSEGSLTSSMVDDVFFILRKCGTRVMASGSVQVMCALLMELNNVAANQLRNALAQRLAPGPGKLIAAAPVDDLSDYVFILELTSLAQPARDYAVALNNSDVAADYMVKLKAEFEGLLSEIFQGSPGAATDRERVRNVLLELQRTAGDLRQSNITAVEQLAEGVMPRTRPALDDLASVSYSMGDAEYAASESGGAGGWVGRLVLALKGGLAWLQPLLTTGNYENTVSTVLDKVLSRIEALLSRKTFTQLGGLALERDLRALVSSVSELTQKTIRDKFTRLNQMALLLGLETIEELRDYWGGDSAITWRLTAGDIKGVLAQRQDFSKDAVSLLRLL